MSDGIGESVACACAADAQRQLQLVFQAVSGVEWQLTLGLHLRIYVHAWKASNLKACRVIPCMKSLQDDVPRKMAKERLSVGNS